MRAKWSQLEVNQSLSIQTLSLTQFNSNRTHFPVRGYLETRKTSHSQAQKSLFAMIAEKRCESDSGKVSALIVERRSRIPSFGLISANSRPRFKMHTLSNLRANTLCLKNTSVLPGRTRKCTHFAQLVQLKHLNRSSQFSRRMVMTTLSWGRCWTKLCLLITYLSTTTVNCSMKSIRIALKDSRLTFQSRYNSTYGAF